MHSTSPPSTSASGLISIWVASFSLKSLYSLTKMSAALSTLAVSKPSFLAVSAASSCERPFSKSMGTVMMAEGSSRATSSMLRTTEVSFRPPPACPTREALHASLARRDERGSSDSTVVEDRDVVLVGGVSSLSEHDLARVRASAPALEIEAAAR